VKTYCKATRLLLLGKQVIGVEYIDLLRGRKEQVFGKLVINATGPWASFLEKDLVLASPLKIAPTMGTILVVQDRVVNHVINRLRPPGDGDILVPSHQSILLGTTSIPVKFEQLDNLMPTPEEIEHLLHVGEVLLPTIRKHRVIRFYSGARPLVASGGSLREASREFDVIDYEAAGYTGLITIFGGKLTTYRLMAEQVGDIACRKLGRTARCETAATPLPGGEQAVHLKEFEQELHVDEKTAFDMRYKWGTFYRNFLGECQTCLDSYAAQGSPRTICECEHVTEPELSWVRNNLGVKILDDYRRRTRQGMGPCQGQFCYYKVADLEAQWTNKSHGQILGEMKFALQKRWKTELVGDEVLKRQIKLAKYLYLMGGNLR
jgi:glycerol-3-phosphate dehydrogenase